jgi:hypothetical protein
VDGGSVDGGSVDGGSVDGGSVDGGAGGSGGGKAGSGGSGGTGGAAGGTGGGSGAKLEVTPATYDFGSVTGCTDRGWAFSVRNAGPTAVMVEAVVAPAGNFGIFIDESTCGDASLPPNGTCRIGARVWLSRTGEGRIDLHVGGDVVAAARVVGSVSVAEIVVTPPLPSVYDFGNVPVGSTKSAKFTFENIGTFPTEGSPWSGSGSGGLSISGCASSLSSGAKCDLTITFAPTAAGTATGRLSYFQVCGGKNGSVAMQGRGI